MTRALLRRSASTETDWCICSKSSACVRSDCRHNQLTLSLCYRYSNPRSAYSSSRSLMYDHGIMTIVVTEARDEDYGRRVVQSEMSRGDGRGSGQARDGGNHQARKDGG